MAGEIVHLKAGDNAITIGIELSVDEVPTDLTAADSIVAILTNRSDGTDVTTITGVLGDADGVSQTELLATHLVAGQFYVEHKVTTGATIVTYPSAREDRVLLNIRAGGS